MRAPVPPGWPAGVLFLALAGLAMTTVAGPLAAAAPALTVVGLRVENLDSPLAVEARFPRLSWRLESAARGARQTAYQVLVASSAEKLDGGEADLWNSGRVPGDQCLDVEYRGAPIPPASRVYWKVRAWGGDGKPTPWSPAAHWGSGLAGAWKAEWIGADRFRTTQTTDAPLAGASWIWWPEGDLGRAAVGPRLFRKLFPVPEGATVEKATLYAMADDRMNFTINHTQVAQGGLSDRVQERDVTRHVRAGINDIRVEVHNDIVSPAGLLVRLVVELGGGRQVTVVTDGTWRVRERPFAYWHNSEIKDFDAWSPAAVVGAHGVAPWGKLKLATLILPPPRLLRTDFTLPGKKVRRATLYATALGDYDLYLNGKRVNDDYFGPGWTDYTRRVLYRAYDASGFLQQGKNAWGIVLGDGWYSAYIGFKPERDHYGTRTRAMAELHVEYGDGSRSVVRTGRDWKSSTGAMLESDFLMGEVYDARKEPAGWATARFDARDWGPVDAGAELKPVVEPHAGPPVRVFRELQTVNQKQVAPGTWVLDMGQNFAGVVRLKVREARGKQIRLRFAERLNPDGTIYVTNLRAARATDTYICAGSGEETWIPRFTFHGYQYVEVQGLSGKPGPETVVGLALSSDTPEVGSFASSDRTLNRLFQNVYWTQRANFIDIPTDCPQRDERLGWTGDAQVYVRTATLVTDVQAFFRKWLQDLADGQRTDGQFPMIAPVKVAGDDGGPAWADAGTICPWAIYWAYGDRRLLERQYPSMVKFVEFCRQRSTPELLPPARYHCFGDWLSIQADTPKDVIYTAYFALSTKLTAKAAQVLGKTVEAARFEDLFQRIKAAFNRAYVNPDGRIRGDTQACYVLALAVDLVDGDRAKAAARYLVEDIEKRGGHLSTGFIGTKDLMLVLASIGRNDVAYRLIHNDTFPSWGFTIKHGATSIWERWDGWTPDKGFQDPGMNSFAHYSFGAVYQWMSENIGGLRQEAPAWKTFRIAPQPGGRLTHARVGLVSPYGPIESNWRIEGKRFHLEVVVPPNTGATVEVPLREKGAVTVEGKALAALPGVRLVEKRDGVAVVSVVPGRYRFESR